MSTIESQLVASRLALRRLALHQRPAWRRRLARLVLVPQRSSALPVLVPPPLSASRGPQS